MNSLRILARSSHIRVKSLRTVSQSVISRQEVQATGPPETLTIPPPSGSVNKPVSPKIEQLVSQISQLNLLEVSELTTALKTRLNLPDAPVMPMGGFMAAGGPAQDEEEAAPQKVQTIFTVKLMKFDDKQKVALIKEIKSLMEGMNLVQAKKFVEGAPAVVKTDIPKEEADKLKEAIEKVGGTVVIE